MSKSIYLRAVSGVAVAGLAGLAAVAAAGPAAATGAVGGGVLVMKGPGSVYAGANTTVTSVTTVGGTATYSAEVVNKGTQLAQFNVRLFPVILGQTVTLTSGSTNVTAVATAARGYFTKLLAPGKSEILTFKDKVPGSATQLQFFSGQLALFDTDGNFLDEEDYETNIRATSGPFDNDLYTSTPGSAAVIAEPGDGSDTAAEAVKPGGKATFTVKAKNDSSTPQQLRVIFDQFPPCDGFAPNFPAIVKVGSADVTPAVRAGTYMTPVLAHNAATTFSVVVSYPSAPPAGCSSEQEAIVDFDSSNNAAEANLLVNLAAS